MLIIQFTCVWLIWYFAGLTADSCNIKYSVEWQKKEGHKNKNWFWQRKKKPRLINKCSERDSKSYIHTCMILTAMRAEYRATFELFERQFSFAYM